MGLLPDTWNRGLRTCRECRERFPCHQIQRKPLGSNSGMHHGTCVTHVPWCMSGSLTCGARGKRSRHSRRMRNPQFYVSGKRPMAGYQDNSPNKCRQVTYPKGTQSSTRDREYIFTKIDTSKKGIGSLHFSKRGLLFSRQSLELGALKLTPLISQLKKFSFL